MLSSISSGGDNVEFQMPSWGLLILLVDAIILVPVTLIVYYTIFHIYPVFAIVEDENPPAYDPIVTLPSSGDDDFDDEEAITRPTNGVARTVTSSLRSINRLLTSHGGFRANFRGFSCALAQSSLTGIMATLFSWGPVQPFAVLMASLALVQLAAAWVHIVISHPSPRKFWRRLPTFKRSFEATWKPVVVYWIASETHRWVPLWLAGLIGFDAPGFTSITVGKASEGDISYLFKASAYLLLSTVLYCVVVIPARVILVRVQASLLPESDDAIIPFDRSFEGKVQPAVVDGLGYATIATAWTTFSSAGWRRVVVLYAKIMAINLALMMLFWVVLIPSFLIILKFGKQAPTAV